MAEFEITTTGIDELNAKLTSITEDMRKKGGRYALRKAAQIIQADAKKRASRIDDPATANNIAANIAIRWNGKLYKRRGDLGFRVGVLGGARQYANTKENIRKGRAGQEYLTDGSSGNPGLDTFYWRFVEFGTRKEFGTSKENANSFMRPALANNVQKATNAFVREYNKAIDRAIKRARK